jgi:hypothetical protein
MVNPDVVEPAAASMVQKFFVDPAIPEIDLPGSESGVNVVRVGSNQRMKSRAGTTVVIVLS